MIKKDKRIFTTVAAARQRRNQNRKAQSTQRFFIRGEEIMGTGTRYLDLSCGLIPHRREQFAQPRAVRNIALFLGVLHKLLQHDLILGR